MQQSDATAVAVRHTFIAGLLDSFVTGIPWVRFCAVLLLKACPCQQKGQLQPITWWTFRMFFFSSRGERRRNPSGAKRTAYVGKMGSICHFPRALPASLWGHCSQILVFANIGAHKKGRGNDTFRAVFPSIWVFWDPQTLQNKGKTQNDKSTLFLPPHVYMGDACG